MAQIKDLLGNIIEHTGTMPEMLDVLRNALSSKVGAPTIFGDPDKTKNKDNEKREEENNKAFKEIRDILKEIKNDFDEDMKENRKLAEETIAAYTANKPQEVRRTRQVANRNQNTLNRGEGINIPRAAGGRAHPTGSLTRAEGINLTGRGGPKQLGADMKIQSLQVGIMSEMLRLQKISTQYIKRLTIKATTGHSLDVDASHHTIPVEVTNPSHGVGVPPGGGGGGGTTGAGGPLGGSDPLNNADVAVSRGIDEFRKNWGTAIGAFVTTALSGFDILQVLFAGAVRDEMEFTHNMRQLAYQVEGVTIKTRELQNAFMDTGSVVKETGDFLTNFQQAYVKILKSGVRDRKQSLSILKSAASLATSIGVETKDTADLFHDWSMSLRLSDYQMEEISRGLKQTARDTGVTGENLLQAAKSAEKLMKRMQDTGQFSSAAAKNILGIQTAAQKFGVADEIAEINAALANTNDLYFNTNDKTKILLYNAIHTMKDMNMLQKLQNGTLLKTTKGMKGLAQGLKNLTMQFGVDLDRLDELDADQLAMANMSLEAATGKQAGQLRKMVDSLLEGTKTFDDRLADINMKMKDANITAQERINLERQARELTVNKSFDFFTALREAMSKGKTIAEAFASLESNKDFDKTLKERGVDVTNVNEKLKGIARLMTENIKKLGGQDLTMELQNALKSGDKQQFAGVMEQLNAVSREMAVQNAQTGPIDEVAQLAKTINEFIRGFSNPLSGGILSILGKVGIIATILAGIATHVAFIAQGKYTQQLVEGFKDWVVGATPASAGVAAGVGSSVITTSAAGTVVGAEATAASAGMASLLTPIGWTIAALATLAAAFGAVTGAMGAGADAAYLLGVKEEELTLNQLYSAKAAGALTGALNYLTLGFFDALDPTGEATTAMARLFAKIPFFGTLSFAIIGSIEAVFGAIYGTVGLIKEVLMGVFELAHQVVEPFVDIFMVFIRAVDEALAPFMYAGDAASKTGGAFQLISDILIGLGKTIRMVLRGVGFIAGLLIKTVLKPVEAIMYGLGKAFEALVFYAQPIVTNFEKIFNGIGQVLVGVATLNFEKLVNGVYDLFTGLLHGVVSLIAGALFALPQMVIKGISGAFTYFGSMADKIEGPIGDILQNLLFGFKLIGGFAENIYQSIKMLSGVILATFEGAGRGIWKSVMPIFDGVMKVVAGLSDILVGIVTLDGEKVWNGLLKGLQGVIQTVISIIAGYWLRLPLIIVNAVSSAFTALGGLADNMTSEFGVALKKLLSPVKLIGNLLSALVMALDSVFGIAIGLATFDYNKITYNFKKLTKDIPKLLGEAIAEVAADAMEVIKFYSFGFIGLQAYQILRSKEELAKFSVAFRDVWTAISGYYSNFMSMIRNSRVVNYVTSAFNRIDASFTRRMQQLGDALYDAFNWIRGIRIPTSVRSFLTAPFDVFEWLKIPQIQTLKDQWNAFVDLLTRSKWIDEAYTSWLKLLKDESSFVKRFIDGWNTMIKAIQDAKWFTAFVNQLSKLREINWLVRIGESFTRIGEALFKVYSLVLKPLGSLISGAFSGLSSIGTAISQIISKSAFLTSFLKLFGKIFAVLPFILDPLLALFEQTAVGNVERKNPIEVALLGLTTGSRNRGGGILSKLFGIKPNTLTDDLVGAIGSAAGGALKGATIGFFLGGPFGAIVGGIAGAVIGLIGEIYKWITDPGSAVGKFVKEAVEYAKKIGVILKDFGANLYNTFAYVIDLIKKRFGFLIGNEEKLSQTQAVEAKTKLESRDIQKESFETRLLLAQKEISKKETLESIAQSANIDRVPILDSKPITETISRIKEILPEVKEVDPQKLFDASVVAAWRGGERIDLSKVLDAKTLEKNLVKTSSYEIDAVEKILTQGVTSTRAMINDPNQTTTNSNFIPVYGAKNLDEAWNNLVDLTKKINNRTGEEFTPLEIYKAIEDAYQNQDIVNLESIKLQKDQLSIDKQQLDLMKNNKPSTPPVIQAPGYASGGSFITRGPQLIAVGEDGQELVKVQPTHGRSNVMDTQNVGPAISQNLVGISNKEVKVQDIDLSKKIDANSELLKNNMKEMNKETYSKDKQVASGWKKEEENINELMSKKRPYGSGFDPAIGHYQSWEKADKSLVYKNEKGEIYRKPTVAEEPSDMLRHKQWSKLENNMWSNPSMATGYAPNTPKPQKPIEATVVDKLDNIDKSLETNLKELDNNYQPNRKNIVKNALESYKNKSWDDMIFKSKTEDPILKVFQRAAEAQRAGSVEAGTDPNVQAIEQAMKNGAFENGKSPLNKINEGLKNHIEESFRLDKNSPIESLPNLSDQNTGLLVPDKLLKAADARDKEIMNKYQMIKPEVPANALSPEDIMQREKANSINSSNASNLDMQKTIEEKILGFGDGGSFLTNGPQMILVGEKGPEMVTVEPTRTMANPVPLSDVHDKIQRQYASTEAGVNGVTDNKEISKIASLNEEQVGNLVSIHEALRELIALNTPTSGVGRTGGNQPGSTRTERKQPLNSIDNGMWQFGMETHGPNKNVMFMGGVS